MSDIADKIADEALNRGNMHAAQCGADGIGDVNDVLGMVKGAFDRSDLGFNAISSF